MTQGENTYWSRGFGFGLPAGMVLCWMAAALPQVSDDTGISETASYGKPISLAPTLTVDSVAVHPKELVPGTPAYTRWAQSVVKGSALGFTDSERAYGDYLNRTVKR